MLANLRWRSVFALPLVLAVALGLMVFTANHSDAAAKKAEQRNAKIVKAVKIGKNQLGDPYVAGGNGPNGFDCSGLTQYAFKKAGINIPRTSRAQAAALRPVSKAKMKRGDLVYFYKGQSVYHAAIYMGKKNGHKLIMHASRSGTPVKVNRIWTNSYKVRTLRL